MKWEGLERYVDDTVDDVLGEIVEFHPFIYAHPGSDYSVDAKRDDLRPIIRTTAIQVRMGARVTGEAALFQTRIIEDDVWVSVQDRKLNGIAFAKPDRVYFVERDEWYEVATKTPSSTGRPDYHLVRIMDNVLDYVPDDHPRSRHQLVAASLPGRGPSLGRPTLVIT